MTSNFHLIGVGGVGMSGLARILADRGVTVSGSDLRDSPTLDALRALGVTVFVGHEPKNVPEGAVIVLSSAVRANNPELMRAREMGSEIIHRAQLLSELLGVGSGIAVSGTHGKTTTSAMLATCLIRSGLDPSFIVGSDVNETGSNAHSGRTDLVVAEADESDGSMLWLAPKIAIITNVEAEHLDHYADAREVCDSFRAFAAGLPEGGLLVACADDEGSASICDSVGPGVTVVTYGIDRGDLRIEPTGPGTGIVREDDEQVATLNMRVPGRHNLLNALAAFAVARHLGVSASDAAEGLAAFQGTRRRMELKGEVGGVLVIDDYAHHPTEVRATLEAVALQYSGRIKVVFQPHLYSRTAELGRGLGASLAQGAKEIALLPIYGAREDPVPGVTYRLVLEGALAESSRRRIAILPDQEFAVEWATRDIRSGDVIVTMGAGDVTQLGPQILARLESR